MESVHGIAVSGGSFPAEIWRLFMEPALEGTEPAAFPEPDGLAGVEAVHARRVRAGVRPDARRTESTETETTTTDASAPTARAATRRPP